MERFKSTYIEISPRGTGIRILALMLEGYIYDSTTLNCPWTDIGAGKLFADFYKEVLRYVPERRSWFCYADGTWSTDMGGLKAMRYGSWAAPQKEAKIIPLLLFLAVLPFS